MNGGTNPIHIRVTEECMGVGNCEQIAPDVFRLNDDGYSEVMRGPVTGSDLALVQTAARNCPTGAIEIQGPPAGPDDTPGPLRYPS
jgi:ferredoxin